MPKSNQPVPRSEISELQPYVPGMTIDELKRKYNITGEIVKLASNENPYGASPKVIKALENNIKLSVSLYPDSRDFIDAIANKYNVSKDMVLLGNGSNDVLDIIARTFLEKGDEAVSSEYAFLVYRLSTSLCGASNNVILSKNFGHDLNAMLKGVNNKTKIVWIANPNNPTGTFLDYKDLKLFIESVPDKVIIVLDEAYYEYLSEMDSYNSIDLLNNHKNLIIVRTMSKIHGLAGLRLGYSIADPKITNFMNRVRHPFNVNTLALIAGEVALRDNNYTQLSKERNAKGLKLLTQQLDLMNLEYLKSYGNFVTVKFKDADYVHSSLLKNGIIVRPLSNYGMPSYLRITIGTTKELKKLIYVLSKIINIFK